MMDIELLVKTIVGLIVILTILIIIFLLPSKMHGTKKAKVTDKKASKSQKSTKEIPTFDRLLAIVKRKDSSTRELQEAVEQIIEHYAKIHPKMGIRSHPDFDKYVDLIVHLVRHKNTNKNLILKLDRALTKNNPDYRAELNDTLTKALNSRGI